MPGLREAHGGGLPGMRTVTGSSPVEAVLPRSAMLPTLVLVLASLLITGSANPDAKRLYDDLLSNYNRLIRPVSNNTHTVLVKLGLRLSQLIDLLVHASLGIASSLPESEDSMDDLETSARHPPRPSAGRQEGCGQRLQEGRKCPVTSLPIRFRSLHFTKKISRPASIQAPRGRRRNLKDQILTTNVWLEHEWQDHKFQWDPQEYGGVTELYVPSEHIWLPDIVLYNNADGEYVVTTMTKAVLHHTGKVLWTPPAIFKSSCEIDVRYFPFDQQTCFMKFGSWSYDGNQIDLKHINQKIDEDNVEIGIDLREYYPSVEWDILGVPAERHAKYYPCCKDPYPDIFFNITLRRKTLFYTVNLIVPCVGISYLSILVFYLPADSGEKIALCITILLSQTMFFLLISEIIPSTSLALPLLGRYILFTMLLVGLCVVITIFVLNIHYRKPSTHKMAPCVRKVFIRCLPRLLLMRVPDQLLADLAAKKRTPWSQNKVPSGTGLAITPSAGSSPESLRHFRPNGLYTPSTTNRFSGLIGALGGNGYSGLPSVAGLDESLSDVAVRKKYPFELEKAIHNVKFIQHHTQRQDEFDAEDQDWGFVAMVLDRLFLWIFTMANIIGTIAILCEAPSLYDDTKPIDKEISHVYQAKSYPPGTQNMDF